MVGMLQIMTYLFAFYLVVKGLEFVQRALAAPEGYRRRSMTLALVVLGASIGVAAWGSTAQDQQAKSVSAAMSAPQF